MKEFLNPEQGYSLVKCHVGKTPIPESWIEVPVGAEILTVVLGDKVFYKSGKPWKWYDEEFKKWMDCSSVVDLDGFDNSLWQRESLNDKMATAEVARQEEKHSHYKKDVSHLSVIDVYRVLELYGVESHAVGHAIKKLLCGGQRGAKGRKQDIQEAIDSLNRELEMVTEDEI